MSPKKVLPNIKGISNVRYSGKTKMFHFQLRNKEVSLTYKEAELLANNDTAKRFINL